MRADADIRLLFYCIQAPVQDDLSQDVQLFTHQNRPTAHNKQVA